MNVPPSSLDPLQNPEGIPVDPEVVQQAQTPEDLRSITDMDTYLATAHQELTAAKTEILQDVSVLLADPNLSPEMRAELETLRDENGQEINLIFNEYADALRGNEMQAAASREQALALLVQLAGWETSDVQANAEQYAHTLLVALGEITEQNAPQFQTPEINYAERAQAGLTELLTDHDVMSHFDPIDAQGIQQMAQFYAENLSESRGASEKVIKLYEMYMLGELEYNLRVQDKADGWGDKATTDDLNHWFGRDTQPSYRPARSSSKRTKLGISSDRKAIHDGNKEIFQVEQIANFQTWHNEKFIERHKMSVREAKGTLLTNSEQIDEHLSVLEPLTASMAQLGLDTSTIITAIQKLNGFQAICMIKGAPDAQLFFDEWFDFQVSLNEQANFIQLLVEAYRTQGEILLNNEVFDSLPGDDPLMARREKILVAWGEGKLAMTSTLDVFELAQSRVLELTMSHTTESSEVLAESTSRGRGDRHAMGPRGAPTEGSTENPQEILTEGAEELPESKKKLNRITRFIGRVCLIRSRERITEKEITEYRRLASFIQANSLAQMAPGETQTFLGGNIKFKRTENGFEVIAIESDEYPRLQEARITIDGGRAFWDEDLSVEDNLDDPVHVHAEGPGIMIDFNLNISEVEAGFLPFVGKTQTRIDTLKAGENSEVLAEEAKLLLEFQELMEDVCQGKPDAEQLQKVFMSIMMKGREVVDALFAEEEGMAEMFWEDGAELLTLYGEIKRGNWDAIEVGEKREFLKGAVVVRRPKTSEIRLEFHDTPEFRLPEAQIVQEKSGTKIKVSVSLPGMTFVHEEDLNRRFGGQEVNRQTIYMESTEEEQTESVDRPDKKKKKKRKKKRKKRARIEEAPERVTSGKLERPDEASIRTEREKIMADLLKNSKPHLRANEYNLFLDVSLKQANDFMLALGSPGELKRLRPDQRASLKIDAIGRHFEDTAGPAGVSEANRYLAATRHLNRQIDRAQSRGAVFPKSIENLSISDTVNVLAQAAYYRKHEPSLPGNYHTEMVLFEGPDGHFVESADFSFEYNYE